MDSTDGNPTFKTMFRRVTAVERIPVGLGFGLLLFRVYSFPRRVLVPKVNKRLILPLIKWNKNVHLYSLMPTLTPDYR